MTRRFLRDLGIWVGSLTALYTFLGLCLAWGQGWRPSW